MVESEIEEKTYPANPFCDVLEREYREEWGGDNLCDCPHCRAERGEYVDPWELEEEDEYFEDDFAEDFELGRSMGSVAGELESIFGLNASSSKADFAKAAKRFAKELGPLPPGFQKGILPVILEVLAKQGKGGLPDLDANLLPFLNEFPIPRGRWQGR